MCEFRLNEKFNKNFRFLNSFYFISFVSYKDPFGFSDQFLSHNLKIQKQKKILFKFDDFMRDFMIKFNRVCVYMPEEYMEEAPDDLSSLNL